MRVQVKNLWDFAQIIHSNPNKSYIDVFDAINVSLHPRVSPAKCNESLDKNSRSV